MLLATSFAELRKFGACKERYHHLAKALGGVSKYGEHTPIPLRKILEINGYEDTDWLLGCATDTWQDGSLTKTLTKLAPGFLKRKRVKRDYKVLDQLYDYCDSKRKFKALFDYAEAFEEKEKAA